MAFAAFAVALSTHASAAHAQATATQTSQPPAGNGLLAGRVLDAAGDGVAGAVVVLGADSIGPVPPRPGTGGRSVPVRTDDEGRFVFTDVPAGRYQVNASKAGWLPGALGRKRPGGTSRSVEFAGAEHRNDLTITMWRPAVIAGLVTDDNGDPLVGVEVRAVHLLHIAGRRQMNVPHRRQKTDDRGAYRFSDLVPGDYVVAVLTSVLSEPPGFAGAIRAAGATPRAYFQTMTSLGAAPIVFDRATGVAAGGRALVDSLAGVSGVPASDGAWLSYPTTYHPSALTQTAATVVRVNSGAPQTTIDVQVRLVPTWQVSGVLTGPDGPAPWHAVHLVAADTGDMPLVDVATAVTDAQGAFTFYGVPPGQYLARVIRIPWPSGPGQSLGIAGGTGAIPYVTLSGGGPSAGPAPAPVEPLMHAGQSVSVGDRHVRDLALTLSAGPRVTGRVVADGGSSQPTAGQWRQVSVWAVAVSGREDNLTIPTGLSADGQFAIPALWPGKYLLRVNLPQGWSLQSAMVQGRDVSAVPIDIADDLENVVVTIADRTPMVRGTVQAEMGTRAEDALVLLFPAEQEGWVDYGRTSRRITSVRLSENGTFSIPAPPDGEYFVVAIPEADAEDWQNPSTLAKLAGVADRVRIQGAAPPPLSIRTRRIR